MTPWDEYELYDPIVRVRLDEAPRKDARRSFRHAMDTKDERIAALGRLVRSAGVQLSASNADIQALNFWFRENAEPDDRISGRMLPRWYSVSHDVAMHLGDVVINRNPNLRWEFFIWGKKAICYQMPVIMGFAGEDPKYKTSAMPEFFVTAYGHRVIEERGSRPQLGSVRIKGVDVDLDRFNREDTPNTTGGEFLHWVLAADRRNMSL